MRPRTAWVLTGGYPGHREPCIGVAERLGLKPRVETVRPTWLGAILAPWGPAGRDLAGMGPYPDLVIASGRQSIPYARAVRRRAAGRSFVAILQDPVVPPSWFDLVWVPEHDRLTGPNVVRTLTTPNRIAPGLLEERADELRAMLGPMSGPFAGVLLGGASAGYRFGAAEADALARDLKAFARRHGVVLLMAPSRRTGAGNVARMRALLEPPLAWFPPDGVNAYLGVMGLADTLIATVDSVNMLGEAAATGRPLYGYRLPGDAGKYASFHAALVDAGAMRWFDGALDHWTYAPINATETVAGEILSRWRARHASTTA